MRKGTTANGEGTSVAPGAPRSLAVAKKGIRTAADFADYMSAMMSDLIEGTMTPNVANAACNAGAKLLKIVELQHKYGTAADSQERRQGFVLSGASRG